MKWQRAPRNTLGTLRSWEQSYNIDIPCNVQVQLAWKKGKTILRPFMHTSSIERENFSFDVYPLENVPYKSKLYIYI